MAFSDAKMGSIISRLGHRYGRLTVLERVLPNTKEGNARWLCRCDCGNQVIVASSHLASGGKQSCNCLKLERTSETHRTHGESGTRLYHIWALMKQRCYYSRSQRYKDYGGRGITVCDEWRESFESFREWAHSAGYQDQLCIDRIDNDGNYCPENCRWTTNKENCNNTRRCYRILCSDGKIRTLQQISENTGVAYCVLNYRLNKNPNIDYVELVQKPKLRKSRKTRRAKDEENEQFITKEHHE